MLKKIKNHLKYFLFIHFIFIYLCQLYKVIELGWRWHYRLQNTLPILERCRTPLSLSHSKFTGFNVIALPFSIPLIRWVEFAQKTNFSNFTSYKKNCSRLTRCLLWTRIRNGVKWSSRSRDRGSNGHRKSHNRDPPAERCKGTVWPHFTELPFSVPVLV